MGQDLRYIADHNEYQYRISRADWQLIQSLREHLPGEIESLFIVPALGEHIPMRTTVLREAIQKVLAFVAQNKDFLPYTYQFKAEVPMHPLQTPGFGTGGMGGIRLPGDTKHYYFIRGGLNECLLVKSAVGEDGRGYKVDERDLRGERELLTENMGVIKIRRTRAKTDLVRALSEIERFLQQVMGAEITKSVE